MMKNDEMNVRELSGFSLITITRTGDSHAYACFLSIENVEPGGRAVSFELHDCRPTPEQTISRKQLRALLHSEVRHLPPLLRNVLLLRDLEELQDMAQTLALSAAVAKSRLLRGRLELRTRMAARLGGDGKTDSPLSKFPSDVQSLTGCL